MTVTIDPVTITTLGVLILAAIGGFIWFGKLSSRVDRLESDVGDLKQGQKEILELIHQQGTELRESIHQQGAELRESIHQQGTELRELIHQQGTEIREQHQQHEKKVLELLNQHMGYHQGRADAVAPPALTPTP